MDVNGQPQISPEDAFSLKPISLVSCLARRLLVHRDPGKGAENEKLPLQVEGKKRPKKQAARCSLVMNGVY